MNYKSWTGSLVCWIDWKIGFCGLNIYILSFFSPFIEWKMHSTSFCCHSRSNWDCKANDVILCWWGIHYWCCRWEQGNIASQVGSCCASFHYKLWAMILLVIPCVSNTHPHDLKLLHGMGGGFTAVWKSQKFGQNVKNIGADTKIKTVPVTWNHVKEWSLTVCIENLVQ